MKWKELSPFLKIKQKMNKIFFKSLAIIISIAVVFTACKTTKSAIAKTSAPQLEKSLLWKIEGNGIKPSYLFGTIHLIAQDDYFMNQPTKDAFEEMEQVVLELDMDDPNMQMEMFSHAAMKDGMTLDKLITPEEYKQVDDFMTAALGGGLEMFKSWQPMLLSGILATKFIDGTPASYEGSFIQMASKSNKEILGLETVQEQLGAMGNITYEDQAKMLMESIQDMDESKKMFATLVDTYKNQDVAGLQKMMIDQSGGVDFATALLDERNEKWIPKIGNFAKAKGTFFAVGSGHLGGEKGVIQLLRNAGYKVTAVTNN